MISFTIFETLFLITLASSFILILFLVYHFKSRILELEKRCDKLFAIVQSIAENMTYEHEVATSQNSPAPNEIKNVVTPFGSFPVYNEDQYCTMSEPIETISDLNAIATQHMNFPEMDDSDISDSDDEDGDLNNEDVTSVDDYDDNQREEDDKITIPTIMKVEKKETEDDDDDDNSHLSSVDAQFYKKMPVADLRKMAREKGLTKYPKRLKKREIIELLCNQTSQEPKE